MFQLNFDAVDVGNHRVLDTRTITNTTLIYHTKNTLYRIINNLLVLFEETLLNQLVS